MYLYRVKSLGFGFWAVGILWRAWGSGFVTQNLDFSIRGAGFHFQGLNLTECIY